MNTAATEGEIHANIRDTLAAMASASARADRRPADTQLLVVSKTWPPETIQLAVSYPHLHFGENRVQEAVEKIPLLPKELDWHFIGHLQKNKIRKVLPLCPTIHSVDSIEMARQVNRIAREESLAPKIYLQVNIAHDQAKFGFTEGTVRDAMEEVIAMEHITLLGLMTIPAFDPDPEKTRPHFAALRELRDRLATEFDVPLPGLSMGMSGDYEVAIEEGSTIVRVGTAIFGRRNRPV